MCVFLIMLYITIIIRTGEVPCYVADIPMIFPVLVESHISILSTFRQPVLRPQVLVALPWFSQSPMKVAARLGAVCPVKKGSVSSLMMYGDSNLDQFFDGF